MRRMTLLVMVAALAVGLTGCGRKSRPIPPEGSLYPRTYPDITFPAGTAKHQDDQQQLPDITPPAQTAPQAGNSGGTESTSR